MWNSKKGARPHARSFWNDIAGQSGHPKKGLAKLTLMREYVSRLPTKSDTLKKAENAPCIEHVDVEHVAWRRL